MARKTKFKIENFNGFKNGIAIVRYDGLFSFINEQGKPITEEWFETATDFVFGYQVDDVIQEYFAVVSRGMKYNLINIKGEYLFSEWLESVIPNGYNIIVNDGRQNTLYDYSGRKISDKYEGIAPMNCGHHIVFTNNKVSLIDGSGKRVIDGWFDDIQMVSNTRAIVKNNGKYNVYKTDMNGGKLFQNDFALIRINNGKRFKIATLDGYKHVIDIETGQMSKPYISIDASFNYNGVEFFSVEENGKYNLIKGCDDAVVLPVWVDDITCNLYGFDLENENEYSQYRLGNDGKWTLYDFSECKYKFENGVSIYQKDGLFNFIDLNNRLISDKWFTKVQPFKGNHALVKNKTKCNILTKDGKLLLED